MAQRSEEGGAALTKGQRTRTRLIESSRRVFERHGYLDARIVDIAAEAGVAVGTFYTYFASKEAIFKELVQSLNVGMFPPAPEGDPVRDPIQSIERANRRFVEFYREHAEIIAINESVSTFIPEFRAMRLATRARSVARNQQAIAELQAAGQIDPSLDPYVTAYALVAMVSNFTYSWFVLGEQFDQDVAVHHLTVLWARALGLDHHYPEPPAPATKRRSRTGGRKRKATAQRSRPARSEALDKAGGRR